MGKEQHRHLFREALPQLICANCFQFTAIFPKQLLQAVSGIEVSGEIILLGKHYAATALQLQTNCKQLEQIDGDGITAQHLLRTGSNQGSNFLAGGKR